MVSFKSRRAIDRNQLKALGILVLLVLGGVVLLSYPNGSLFQPFLGGIHPFVAIGLLSFLLSKRWFTIYREHALKSMLPYVVFTLLFTTVAILIDINVMYPEDMNIPFPESLLFYPVIAFLVEIIFHVLPLTLLFISATFVFSKPNFRKLVLSCILLVALFEPTYQIIFTNALPIWATVVVYLNLFLFNITQLFVFKKYGFMCMYTLRILYYSIWHVIWGVLRLELLF